MAGIRVITYLESDVRKVADMIETLFDIDKANSLDQAQLLGSDRLGYRSVHYVAKFNKSRCKLPEYKKKNNDIFKKSGDIKRSFYEKELFGLQHEMVKLQQWVIENDKRLLVVFEGMDTGGKSSTIKEFMAYLNPREARSVALPKPNSKEVGQWYFQRHLKQIPNAGVIVFFDR